MAVINYRFTVVAIPAIKLNTSATSLQYPSKRNSQVIIAGKLKITLDYAQSNQMSSGKLQCSSNRCYCEIYRNCLPVCLKITCPETTVGIYYYVCLLQFINLFNPPFILTPLNRHWRVVLVILSTFSSID